MGANRPGANRSECKPILVWVNRPTFGRNVHVAKRSVTIAMDDMSVEDHAP